MIDTSSVTVDTMDTTSHEESIPLSTSTESNELEIIQPTQPHEANTISNIIVYNSETVQQDQQRTARRINPKQIIMQKLQLRRKSPKMHEIISSCITTEMVVRKAELIQMYLHIHAITFLKSTNYLFNCEYYNVYSDTHVQLIHATVGRQPTDPFSNYQMGENMIEDSKLIEGLPVPMKMDLDQQLSPNMSEKLTLLQYLQERMSYLNEHKMYYKYRIDSFGFAMALTTPFGKVSIEPEATPVNLSIEDIIFKLSKSIENVKNNSNQSNKLNNITVQTKDVTTINVKTGENNSSIKINATNPNDPGPVTADKSSIIRGSSPYYASQDEYEEEEIGPPHIFSDYSNSWERSNYDDYISSTPAQSTPSFNLYYPIYEHLKDVSNDQNENIVSEYDDEDVRIENNISARHGTNSRVRLTRNTQSNLSNNVTFQSTEVQSTESTSPNTNNKEIDTLLVNSWQSIIDPIERHNEMMDKHGELFNNNNQLPSYPTTINNKSYGNNIRPAITTDPVELPSILSAEIAETNMKNLFSIVDNEVEDSNELSNENSISIDVSRSPDTYDNDLLIIEDRFDEIFGINGYDSDRTHSSMPELTHSPTSSPDPSLNESVDDWDEEIDAEDQNDEILSINTINAFRNITHIDTNLLFNKLEVGKGKQFISGASGYPPRPTVNVLTNNIIPCRASYSGDNVIELDTSNRTSLPESFTTPLCILQDVPQTTSIFALSSEFEYQNQVTHALFADHSKAYKHVNQNKIKTIETRSIRWWIKVPVLLDNGQIEYIAMMADTGANHPCCNTTWAFEKYAKYIDKVSKHDTIISTASNTIKPKYALYFLFPTPSGIFLKAKFYLLDKLPVNILADINMLYSFGYQFKQNDKPIKFVHNEEPDGHLHIKTFEGSHKIHEYKNNQLTLLENMGELCESIVTQQQDTLMNKSNAPTLPSILCSTLQEYEFYKLHMDHYNQQYTVNYINGDLSIAQDVWAPVEHEQQNEKQIYLFGCSTEVDEKQKRKLQKRKLIANMTTPIQNLQNYNKYQTKTQITSIAAINQAYTEHFEMNKTSKNESYALSVKQDVTNAMNKYEKLTRESTTINAIGVNEFNPTGYSYQQTYNAVVNTTPNKQQTFNINYLKSDDAPKQLGKSIFSRLTTKLAKINNGKILNARKIIRPSNEQHQINFILMKESFRATLEEEVAAKLLNSNKVLKKTDLTYLKEVEKLAPRFNGLHSKMVALRNEFEDIFATETYSRRTMKVEPARLGIIEKFRHITCFRAQYPLSVQKRLWMIEYTNHNRKNGYWVPVDRTLHCIPYLMIPKRDKNGNIIRYRPAFDARVVNQYLELYPIHLPTMRDFDEIYSIKGLFTLMDLKNMFDCIPLHKADRPWSTVMTPVGIYMMHCLAYGFKNCPYYAQNIMNKFAMHCGLTLAYIDDVVMKHHWHWNAQQHIDHLRKAFEYFRAKNMLLNPSKFFPFVTKCTSFGIERTLHGSCISDAYKQKILALTKPETKTQLREFQGVLNYVSRYIYNGSMIQYWLNQLLSETPEKRGNLKWNDKAQVAFEQLKFLAANAPVLHNPTIDGEFMVKTDACLTGIGAVLYQQQYNPKIRKKEWIIVDMFHQMMPKDLRKAHSTVHEAYAVVQALQHWQMFLMKRKFILFTDNRPVAIVFTENYEKLNQLTQSQLIRLRVALAPFTFEIKHVKGVENKIADALSRESLKIIKTYYPHATKPADLSTDKDWLMFGEAIISRDTRYKKKTQEEIDEINSKALEVSKQVYQINQQLIHHNYNLFVQKLSDNEAVRAQNRSRSQPPVRVPDKVTLIQSELNNVYNITLSNWKKQQPFCKQQMYEQLLKHQNIAVITKDEYSNDEPMRSTMTKCITNCFKYGNKIQLPVLNIIAETQQNTYDDLYTHANVLFQLTKGKKSGCIHENLDNFKCTCRKIPSHNSKTHQSLPTQTTMHDYDSESDSSTSQYDPKSSQKQQQIDNKAFKTKLSKRKIKHLKQLKSKLDEIENTTLKQARMTLRSDTRKQNDSQTKRTSYLNEDFDDLTDRRLVRQEFLYNLFGHRDKTIFNPKIFQDTQNADTEIQLVKSIIARIESNDTKITRNNLESFEYANDEDESKLTKQQIYDNAILFDYEQLVVSNTDMALHIVDGALQIVDDLLVYKQIIDNKEYITKVVPGILKHKLMDHAHHNIHSHHPHWKQTLNNIIQNYWWTTMTKDIRRFVQRCLLCNYANGSITNRAPLTTREPVLPRESLFGDYIELQLAGKRFYILVLVDYCTGWTMLIPTKTNNAYTVVDAILRKWIPLHGLFKYFDADQGSGFIANVTKLLIQGLDTDVQFAEPGYHRGIGKVERTIKMIQDQFQRINIQWDEVITDCTNADHVFNILRVIAPHIQAALNQRRPRISTFSPNMLMFGTQLKDLSNIDIVIKRMREIFCRKNHQFVKKQVNKLKREMKNKNKNENNIGTQNEFFESSKYRTNPLIAPVTTDKNQNESGNTPKTSEELKTKQKRIPLTQQWRINAWNKKKKSKNTQKSQQDRINNEYHDYIYIEKLLEQLKTIYKQYSSDWHKYMYESKKQYDNKYNIDDNKIARNNKIFTVGTKVLYFVGDKQKANRKWLRRFTGPWTIVVVLSDSTVIIEDTQSKIQKRVSINRLKIFKQNEMIKYSQQFDHHEYDEYSNHLKNILFKVGSSDRELTTKTGGTQLNYKLTRKSINNKIKNYKNNRKNNSFITRSFKIKRKILKGSRKQHKAKYRDYRKN